MLKKLTLKINFEFKRIPVFKRKLEATSCHGIIKTLMS